MADHEFCAASLADITADLRSATADVQLLDQSTLDLQLQIAGVPAPTGDESGRAQLVASLLRARNLRVRIDSTGNVVSTHNTSADLTAPVVCMAHLDTVFGADTPLAVTQDGARFNCPGIGDNSRGLATMLTLAAMHAPLANRIERESNVRVTKSFGRFFATNAAASAESARGRPVEFVATVGEEGLGNLRGARAYFESRVKRGLSHPHAVLVLDGPGDQNVVHHALGSHRYRITFGGPGGHSWADFGTPNAVHAASRCAVWISEFPRTISDRVAVTVSGIGGGESVNSIPMNAWLDVDVRARDAQLLTRIDLELRKAVHAATEYEQRNSSHAARSEHSLVATVSLVGDRPAGSIDASHPLVELANDVTRHFRIEPVSAIASTDANIPLSLGIPAITIGGGGTGGAAHTTNEWYDNTNGPRGVARAFAILRALTIR